MVERAVKEFGGHELLQVFILVLRHLVLDLARLLEVATAKSVGPFTQILHQLGIIKRKLKIGHRVRGRRIVVINIHLHQPGFDRIGQKLLKLVDSVLFLTLDLHECIVLRARDLSLDRVVADRDEL